MDEEDPKDACETHLILGCKRVMIILYFRTCVLCGTEARVLRVQDGDAREKAGEEAGVAAVLKLTVDDDGARKREESDAVRKSQVILIILISNTPM